MENRNMIVEEEDAAAPETADTSPPPSLSSSSTRRAAAIGEGRTATDTASSGGGGEEGYRAAPDGSGGTGEPLFSSASSERAVSDEDDNDNDNDDDDNDDGDLTTIIHRRHEGEGAGAAAAAAASAADDEATATTSAPPSDSESDGGQPRFIPAARDEDPVAASTTTTATSTTMAVESTTVAPAVTDPSTAKVGRMTTTTKTTTVVVAPPAPPLPPPRIPSAPTSSYRSSVVAATATAKTTAPTTTTTTTTATLAEHPEAMMGTANSDTDDDSNANQNQVEKGAEDNVDDNDDDDDDDDVVSQAAVTYAALAAAATANHKSPAEAARSARIAAQTILFPPTPSSSSSTTHGSPTGSSGAGDHPASDAAAAHFFSNAPKTGSGAGTGAVKALPLSRIVALLRQQLDPVSLGGSAGGGAADAADAGSATTASAPHRKRINPKGGAAKVGRHLLRPDHFNVGMVRHLFWVNYYLLVDDELDNDNIRSTSTVTGGGDAVSQLQVTTSKAAQAGTPAIPNKPNTFPCYEQDESTLLEACAAFWSLLHKVDGAYESLTAMLPSSNNNNTSVTPPRGAAGSTSSPAAVPLREDGSLALEEAAGGRDDDVDVDVSASSSRSSSSSMLPFPPSIDVDDSMDYETPVVVPDLLPPCTAPRGDATLAFFRACVGTEDDMSASTATAASTAATLSTTTTTNRLSLTQPDSSAPPPPLSDTTSTTSSLSSAPSSPGKGAATSSSSFLGMFKRASLTSPAPSSPSGPGQAAASATASASTPSNLLGAVFRKKGPPYRTPEPGSASNPQSGTDKHDASGSVTTAPMSSAASSSSSSSAFPPPGCYTVKIEREMLGLTVENVLERTVVRTVLPGGPAKKAGAQVGSLITAVGNTSTRNLTHFETIDELRQSQRPLLLVLKHVGDDALRMAREEMGRLIRGAGFGITDEDRPGLRDVRLEAYNHLIKRRWDAAAGPPAGGVPGVDRLGEKLVWLLTLFAYGLEREADRLESVAGSFGEGASPRRRHSVFSHTSQDYSDAAKSVGRVLWDYSRKKLQLPQHRKPMPPAPPPPPPPPPLTSRRAMALHPPGHALAAAAAAANASSGILEKPLLQIGDVLQRTRTFLADTTSPPAALLRGELISFLCDVLDADTDMELAEEESVSSSVGGGMGGIMGGGGNAVINDLGSAGSLLKLIVLNAPIMRSPGCDAAAALVDEEELRRRFGPRESAFTADDVHKLHAGNRFLSIVHRLAASRSTSARITACSLGPVLWGHLDFPHQLQLRGVITRALHDVEVIVRKSTATVLHEIAELVFDRRCVPWLVLMCERAMTDPEPQLRSAAMTLTWHLAEHLPNAFLGNASQGSRYLRRLPSREDPIFADVYLLQCKLLPVATRLAEDRSPSVRLAVAAQCDRLCDALGDHWSSVIIDVLLALLSDSDERVRCEAVACVPRLAEIVLLNVSPGGIASVSEVSILEALLPASMKLQADPSSSVRIALAAAAGELLALLVSVQARVVFELHHLDSSAAAAAASHRRSTLDPEEASRKYKVQVDDRMIPLLQALLNDKDPEVTSAALRAVTNATRRSVQQVRHRHMSTTSLDDDAVSLSSYHSQASDPKSAVAAAPVLAPVLSETQVLRLLPTLSELAGSKQWRVRQSAVEIVPALLGCTSQMPTRREIAKLCVRLLMGDDVDAVRKSAAECLCMGGSSLGSHGEDASAEYMTMIVVPTIRNCAVHSSSKQRLLSLKMVQTVLVSGACPSKWKGSTSGGMARLADTPLRELASIALSLTSDPIANVRLNVGRSLEPVLHVFEDDDLAFIQQILLQQVDQEGATNGAGGGGGNGGGDRDVLYFANRCVQRSKQILDDRALGASNDDANSSRLSC